MSVTITCKRKRSRRRCGLEFTREPQTFADGHFTDEELERLQADPVLTVEIVDEGPEVPGKSASHAVLDAFAEENKDDHPELAEFIGKDAGEGWTRALKLQAIEEALTKPFSGSIENVQTKDRVLSAAEIAESVQAEGD